MTRVIRALGAVAIILAISASAASAAGNEFVASKIGGTGAFALKGASGTVDDQVFKLPPFTISCSRSRVSGALAEPESSGASGTGFDVLDVALAPSACVAELEVGGQQLEQSARFASPLQLEYLGETREAIVAPTTIDVRPLHCTIEIRPGVPDDETKVFGNEVVTARNLHAFPSGYQRKLKLDNELYGISYAFGGNCAGFTPSGEGGAYSGVFPLEVPNGNVEYTPFEIGWEIVKNKIV